MQSKSECYRFLSSDCHVFLPPQDTVTIWFLKELMAGDRRRISCKDVKLINVPQFEGLSKEKVLAWVEKRPNKKEILRALPAEEREIKKLPRAWIFSIINTLDGEFGKWIEIKKKERVALLVKERELGINMDPEIARIFRSCSAISSKLTLSKHLLFISLQLNPELELLC